MAPFRFVRGMVWLDMKFKHAAYGWSNKRLGCGCQYTCFSFLSVHFPMRKAGLVRFDFGTALLEMVIYAH